MSVGSQWKRERYRWRTADGRIYVVTVLPGDNGTGKASAATYQEGNTRVIKKIEMKEYDTYEEALADLERLCQMCEVLEMENGL